MGYFSDLHITLTKRDYLHMLKKDRENDNICDCFLNEEKAYIKYYEKKDVECVSIRQFNYKYYKEFDEVQSLEQYLKETKSGYVFFRTGSRWDDMEYRNTAKYKELETPFRFIDIIRKETLDKVNIQESNYKETKKEYVITDVKDIIEYCKGNNDIISLIHNKFNRGTQFKLILNIDVSKEETMSALFLREPTDTNYNLLSSETIDIKKSLEFLGYPNREKFLEDINRTYDIEEEEEFE